MSALLHLVGFSPERSDQTALLYQACSPDDTLVLLDAGLDFVGKDALEELRVLVPDGRILVLADRPGAGDWPTLDYIGLVALTETHRGPASWY